MQADGVPVVRAFIFGRLPGGNLHVGYWCGGCGWWHLHGVGIAELEPPGAHRLSHCAKRAAPIYVLAVGVLPTWLRDERGGVKERLSRAEVRRLEMAVVP